MDKKYIVKNCPCFNEGHPDLDLFGECLDLTQAEYVELIDKGIELVNSNIPPYLKKSVENALEYIDREREK